MPSFNDFPHIFTPIKIRNIELKNRLVFSPVVSGHAGVVDGQVTEALVQFPRHSGSKRRGHGDHRRLSRRSGQGTRLLR